MMPAFLSQENTNLYTPRGARRKTLVVLRCRVSVLGLPPPLRDYFSRFLSEKYVSDNTVLWGFLNISITGNR